MRSFSSAFYGAFAWIYVNQWILYDKVNKLYESRGLFPRTNWTRLVPPPPSYQVDTPRPALPTPRPRGRGRAPAQPWRGAGVLHRTALGLRPLWPV